MRREEFRKNIACYGPDVAKWPDPLREEGYECLNAHPSLQEDRDTEIALASLLENQPFEVHSDDLAARIIAQAVPRTQKEESALQSWFISIIAPTPVYSATLALALIVGFTVGYSGALKQGDLELNKEDEVTVNEFLYYDGELL